MNTYLLSDFLPRTVDVSQCPLCSSSGKIFLSNLKDYLFGVPGDYNYQRCNSCNTVYQSPMVISEDLTVCYPDNYYTHTVPNNINGNVHLSDLFEKESKKSLRGGIRYSLIKAMQQTPQKGF